MSVPFEYFQMWALKANDPKDTIVLINGDDTTYAGKTVAEVTSDLVPTCINSNGDPYDFHADADGVNILFTETNIIGGALACTFQPADGSDAYAVTAYSPTWGLDYATKTPVHYCS